MTPTRQGSFHLFRFKGINVYLHWSWFLVAVYQISARSGTYSTPVWMVLEYLALFLIVLMHEFGHALACRQTGGTADQIVLWPLGGVAYVNPPQRAGATLWSIVGGPLVNIALIPVLWGLIYLGRVNGWNQSHHDFFLFLHMMALINKWLLIFNLMPVFPLDGGQILRSLLWFPLGRAKSLLVATTIGFMGGAVFIWMLFANMQGATISQLIWPLALVGFLLMNCWSGFKHALALQKLAKLPRHADFDCPSCHAAPPEGSYWGCSQCGKGFDIFAGRGVCPHCGAAHDMAVCVDCGVRSAIDSWRMPKL
ncbi:MAG TPA: M50 family metallopeptidase [Rariglobus sp.]|jgi:Zn-dependent protease|nr:M50 family metallopeptidase [Rariglobus sp.]